MVEDPLGALADERRLAAGSASACISRFSSTVMSVNTLRPPGMSTQALGGEPLGGERR